MLTLIGVHKYLNFFFQFSDRWTILMFIIFILYFQTAGPFEERGMVMGVLDKAFDVFIMKFGVIKRVYCDVRYIFIRHNKCELWYIDVTILMSATNICICYSSYFLTWSA